MDRFLCLDIGDKRIGVAVSDPFNSYALPVKTYVRKNLKEDLRAVSELVKEKYITAVVCGLPVNFDGKETTQTKKVAYFIERLKETLIIPVIAVDERCTTCEAEELLIKQGKSIKERKSCVDSLAATSILEGFLSDFNNKKRNNKGEYIMSEKEKKCDCGCEHDHHEHDCDCGCEHDGCDCGCEDDIVELTADDGRKLKFYFVGTIEYKGKNYSAFEPAEEIEGVSEDDLIIFELKGSDEEDAELIPIEDEKLLDEVFNEFCRLIDEDEEEG